MQQISLYMVVSSYAKRTAKNYAVTGTNTKKKKKKTTTKLKTRLLKRTYLFLLATVAVAVAAAVAVAVKKTICIRYHWKERTRATGGHLLVHAKK